VLLSLAVCVVAVAPLGNAGVPLRFAAVPLIFELVSATVPAEAGSAIVFPPTVTVDGSVTVPVSVGDATEGEVALTTAPDPVVLLICDGAMLPLLSPSGIPSQVPGVPAATLTHPATPLAVAPEFCSRSPRLHSSVVGAEEVFVGNCISSPTTGAEKERFVAAE
jgi:hypothetical protein